MTWGYREVALILRWGHCSVRLRRAPLVGAGIQWRVSPPVRYFSVYADARDMTWLRHWSRISEGAWKVSGLAKRASP